MSEFIRSSLIQWSLGVLALVMHAADLATAQSVGYRVETDVFAEGIKEPLQQTLTLFSDGVGYDISREDDGQFTMVDSARGRIILLNAKLEIRTQVAIREFEALVESAKAVTELSVYVDGARKTEDLGDSIRVGDEVLLYEATLQEPSNSAEATAIAESYRKFADALILLNCAHPGAAPPFARLALNEAVCAKGALPKEIKKSAKRGQHVEVHKVLLHATWLLSKSDEGRIAEIGRMLTSDDFQDVSYGEYQRRMADVLAKR
jgi:hypothetical protein